MTQAVVLPFTTDCMMWFWSILSQTTSSILFFFLFLSPLYSGWQVCNRKKDISRTSSIIKEVHNTVKENVKFAKKPVLEETETKRLWQTAICRQKHTNFVQSSRTEKNWKQFSRPLGGSNKLYGILSTPKCKDLKLWLVQIL